jgi:uncharacterized protein (DUF849 family)
MTTKKPQRKVILTCAVTGAIHTPTMSDALPYKPEDLLDSDSYIFRNTFRDIAMVARELGEGEGVKFEHECYDVGHLYNLKFCMDTGLFKAPVFIQFVLGILGGIGADIENLVFMKRTADKLFGDNYRWSVLGAGAAQMDLAVAAATMGGNVRVGLEDSLFIGRGRLASSNAEQVAKVRRMLADHGLEVATPDEAREMLGLKGRELTRFQVTPYPKSLP